MNSRRIKTLTTWLINQTQKLDPNTVWGEIELVLCDDTQIRTVKNEVFARDEVTDVIALRYEPMPGIEESSSAEIFVNVLRASQCSRRNGWNPSKELALYIAHGCDHLSGADDATPKQYLQMRRRELRWLRKAAETGLTADLIQDY